MLRLDYCKKPYVEHGKYSPEKKYYAQGDQIKYSCMDDQYYMDYYGEKYEMTMCKEDGQWDKTKPVCKSENTT